ncbi:uncharacterized protein LOC125078263 [Lutra lutra]|uniref:uncharacterized protein LOC125078263 n=1 Tax=Lutra lutra TaxID=9657 RepID=UPI001FD13733|nr:uncharacterized protein LOC125078263 [Lutra lutra]
MISDSSFCSSFLCEAKLCFLLVWLLVAFLLKLRTRFRREETSSAPDSGNIWFGRVFAEIPVLLSCAIRKLGPSDKERLGLGDRGGSCVTLAARGQRPSRANGTLDGRARPAQDTWAGEGLPSRAPHTSPRTASGRSFGRPRDAPDIRTHPVCTHSSADTDVDHLPRPAAVDSAAGNAGACEPLTASLCVLRGSPQHRLRLCRPPVVPATPLLRRSFAS